MAALRSDGDGGVSSTRRCAGVSAVIVRDRADSSASSSSSSSSRSKLVRRLTLSAGEAAREYRSAVPCSCASRSQ